jgi:putative ABC transport system permease protein
MGWRFFRKPSADADLEEEFQAHLEIEIRQLMDRGMPPAQAEVEARRRFGNRTQILERTRQADGRGQFAGLTQDLRYAARVLRREPGFTAAAVLSLALGIGATTAVFSIADTIYLRPLPYADAARLVWVGIRFPGIAEFVPSPDYVAWRRENHVFQELAATQAHGGDPVLMGGAEPAEVHASRVSANFLAAFALAPAIGRTFVPEEELPNGPKAVLLTDPFWRDHFHGRRDAVGSTIPLDGQSYTIIGVLPRRFIFPLDIQVDMLTTLPVSPTASHHDRNMYTWAVFGRLKPGVTVAQARADVAALFAASKADTKLFRADNNLVVERLQEHRAGNARMLLLILMGAAGCLLAIACANVANLLLARWAARSRELAVRTAVGAGRARLARQLFTEIAVLIAAGAAAGMLLVSGALAGFVHFAGRELPRLSEVSVDPRVFGVALLVSLATALLFGGIPLWQAARIDPQSVLQHAGRGVAGGGHRLLRRALVSVEVALSVVLLSGAALLFQTLWHLRNDHLGFQPEHALTVSVPVRGASYSGPVLEALAADILNDLRRIPGTEAAALTQCTPISTRNDITFTRSDRPLPEPFHRGDDITECGVGPDYLKAAGTPLLRGRFFTEEDEHQPGTLAVINAAAARAYFPGENPLGKQIMGGRMGPWKTVVGVVGDSKNQGLNQPAMPEAFVNDASHVFGIDLLFIVRTIAREGAFARALHDQLHAGHPGLFTKIQTLDDEIGQSTASPRFNTVLLSSFAAIAFLMAVVGVYGVLAFAVVERRQELGIRMALGASPPAVIALVMREGTILLACGTLAGVAAALALTRYLASLLYGVTATDTRTYIAVVIGLSLAAAMATWLPARRAAAADPMAALRCE